MDIPPLRLAGRAPVTMPDRVRTGDIWQVLSDERDERYVVVIAGLAGYDARPYFTVAGTSPHVEYVGPGDVVVDKASRGIRVGYEFMLCTWSAAGVPERQFEQFLGRVRQPAQRTLVAAHRRGEPAGELDIGIVPELTVEVGREHVARAAFRTRLQRRLELGLLSVDPRNAELPIERDTILDRQPPAWLTALASHFAPGEVPMPYEVARILRLEQVTWLPSTKRNVKWLFRQFAPPGDAWVSPEQFALPESAGSDDDERAVEPPRPPDPERERERVAERYANEVAHNLEERLRWLDP